MLNAKAKSAAILAGAILLLAGCGNENSKDGGNAKLNPVPAAGGSVAGTAGDLASQLRGNYSGGLQKIVQYYNQDPLYVPASGQPFTMTLNIVPCSNNPQAQCAQGIFQTAGEAGTTNPVQPVEMSYLGFVNGNGGAQIHVLQQYKKSTIPGFYTTKIVALELRVALISVSGGTTYDPTQSATRVMDCVLSQGAYTCRTMISDVRFVGNLGKS